jgi:hypothetical protein
MVRFFFDTDDGVFFAKDDLGVELSDAQRAEKLATETVATLARDHFSSGAGHRVTITVRTETKVIFEAEVLLKARQTTEQDIRDEKS